MSTVADVVAAVGGRLTATFDDPDVAVWPDPPNASRLPAVWLEVLNGGGPAGVSTLRPVTVRVVYVPAPRQNNVQHADLVDAVDRLNAAFAGAVASGVVTDQTVWTFDAVEVGGVAYDAVLYDLALSHHLTC